MSWKNDVHGFYRDERDRDPDREELDRDRGMNRGYGSFDRDRDRAGRGYGSSYGSSVDRDRFMNELRYGNQSRYGSSEGYGDRNRDSLSGGSMERERWANRDRGTSYGTYGRDWERERARDFGLGERDLDRGGYPSEGTSRSGYSSGSRYSGEHDRYSGGRPSHEDFGPMSRDRESGFANRFSEEDRYQGSRDRWNNEGGFSGERGRWSAENERMSSDRYRWDRGGYDRDADWRNRR